MTHRRAHKRREEADRFLVDAANLLASSLDYEQTLAGVAQLAVRGLADFCVIDIVEGGGFRRAQVADADPDRARVSARLLEHPLDPMQPHISTRVVATGEPVIVADVTPAELDAVSRSEEHRRVLDALNIRSMMAVPLVARGQIGGVLLLGSASRRFGPGDLAVAEQLGRIAGLEVENARQFGEAQRALQARDRVLGVVAHDLRNPLNTIVTSTELLLQLPLSEDQRAHQLQVIMRSAMRMDRLIQDLLDVARLEADRLVLEREALVPCALAREAVEQSGPRAAARHQSLTVAPCHGVPMISADRHRILQVLYNLLENAIKFTPEGGAIEVSAVALGDHVCYTVADTGPGVPAEDLPHLFRSFWQGKVHRAEGTGLGLAIARGIVEAHGGRIWVENRPGGGSAFLFTVPALGRAGPVRLEARDPAASREPLLADAR